MFIYSERTIKELFKEEGLDVFTEAVKGNTTFIIRDKVYPRISKFLETSVGKQKFSAAVGEFVNRHNSKLTAVGPVYMIPFTDVDKLNFYKLFNITEDELKEVSIEVCNVVNEKASWRLIRDNPFFILCYCIIRYFTITKDSKLLQTALILTALVFYPSVHAKYFQYQPNPGIMQYTIDNLSNRFIIKKTSHIFGTLSQSIQSSWKFHEKNFYKGSDQDFVWFVQRIRNDQNSLIKKIAQAYYENYKKGLSVSTQVDSYEDQAIVDNDNNSNKVESITNKVVMKMLINGIDLKLCDAASAAANVSRLDLRNYISKIVVDKNLDVMKQFIESIVFIFLYDEKKEIEQINSMEFTAFAIKIFKKTNSLDKNVNNIKDTLEKWGKETGIFSKYVKREATRIEYTKAVFLYFILSIQKYT